jgi:amino acid transporter
MTARRGLLLAMVLSGLVALATGLSAASLGAIFPEEGGEFTWSRKFGYDTLGFVAGCAYLGKGVVSTAVISLAFATYTTQVVPGLPAYGMHLMAAVAILSVAAVSYLGIGLNARVLISTLFVELVLLGVFVAFAIPAMKPGNLTPVLGNGSPCVLAGAAIFFWSWDGFMRTAIMASEIKNPRRTSRSPSSAESPSPLSSSWRSVRRPSAFGARRRRLGMTCRSSPPVSEPWADGDLGRCGGRLAGYAHRGARRLAHRHPGGARHGQSA